LEIILNHSARNHSYWRDRRVFITGCTGFLGSWLTAGLVAQGADVVGLIRDRVPQAQIVRSGLLASITTVEGELTDYEFIERVLAEYEVDTIFHLAAQTIVNIANRAPLSTFETNIRGTWILLEAARRNPTVNGIVVASSYHAYGEQAQLPYKEDSPLDSCHPYDLSKSCADMIARAYAASYGMPVVVTRFANLFGGGDLNWNRLVPGTIRSVLRGDRPVIRSDGTYGRDYLFIEDAVDGYLTLAKQLHKPEICGQAFNFGMDRPITVLEIVNTILGLSEFPDLEPQILNQVQNEVLDKYLSSQKAHSILGWQPGHTLEEGLAKSMNWYREYLKFS
jgi:CDP-glucose 4,6-dehydratase